MLTRRTLLGAGTALLALPSLARAQSDWPARPVRVIVPFPPGGSVDIIARVLQPRLQEALGRPIVVENRGGAAGSVGAGEAARAAPDGYTWLLAYDTQATNESVMRLPFNTLEAFAPISLLANGPLALVAHRDAPWQTLQALIADAKARPDAISYATSGVGGLAHVATTLLGQQGGFRMTHVPYRGAGPAVQDVLAGHVPLFMSNVVVIKEHMASGALRPLGVSTAAESPHVPGVRSFAQQGFPRAGRGRHRFLQRAGGCLPAQRDRQVGEGDPRQRHPRGQLRGAARCRGPTTPWSRHRRAPPGAPGSRRTTPPAAASGW